MTIPGEGVSHSPSAKETKAQAAAWLERRDRSDWSKQDQAELDAWLAESVENYLFYHRVESVWERSQRLVAFRHPRQDVRRAAPQAKRRPFLLAAAAIGAAALVLGVGGPALLPSPAAHTFETPVGGHEVVTLKDGSSIELNTNTIVHTTVTADRRAATIEKGEAFFKIAHDAAHPFIVTASNTKITVLGTKFSVRDEPNRVEVKLVEGKVWFMSDDGKSALMSSGDTLIATSRSLTVSKRSSAQLTNELGWRRGLLVFQHTPLGDAVAEFNRYNHEKLVIRDASVAQLTVSGALPAQDPQEFLTVTKKFFDLRVQHRGDEIVISR
jgi:transmembrane sensor